MKGFLAIYCLYFPYFDTKFFMARDTSLTRPSLESAIFPQV